MVVCPLDWNLLYAVGPERFIHRGRTGLGLQPFDHPFHLVAGCRNYGRWRFGLFSKPIEKGSFQNEISRSAHRLAVAPVVCVEVYFWRRRGIIYRTAEFRGHAKLVRVAAG